MGNMGEIGEMGMYGGIQWEGCMEVSTEAAQHPDESRAFIQLPNIEAFMVVTKNTISGLQNQQTRRVA